MSYVNFKFQCEKNYRSLLLDDVCISVSDLKEQIFQFAYSCQGTDVDIRILNPVTNQEYVDEEALICKNTSVLVRRVPGYRIVKHEEGQSGFKCLKPHQGYVCRRCNKPGHLIRYCVTNGNPDYDIKKAPAVIPDERIMRAFEKEMESLPTTHSLGDLPPELYCVLCNKVMRDAVLTSKCCLNSFCDKCIRDNIIEKASCLCGANDILADHLIPNKTLRDTITRILDSSSSSSSSNKSARSVSQLQSDTESAKCSQSKIASPTQSGVSMDVKETLEHVEITSAENSVKPPKPSTQKLSVKKKKAQVAADSECRTPQHLAADSFMMPNCASTCGYDPYWTGIQLGMEGYMGSYGSTPTNMPFLCAAPNDPFIAQNLWFPMAPPQMDMETASISSMSYNVGSPSMTREGFKSGKADLKRKQGRESGFSDQETSSDSRISHSNQARDPNKKRKLASGPKPLSQTKTHGLRGPVRVQ